MAAPAPGAAVESLLSMCKRRQQEGKLTAAEVELVEEVQEVLARERLLPESIGFLTVEQLASRPGMSLGAAAALKKAFSSAADPAGGGAGSAAGTSVPAKTIKIYDPLQDPELYDITFFSEAKFDSWLGRGFITGLFKEGQAPAIIYYDDLEDNALYTLEMCSGIPTRIKSMEKAMSHLGSRREVELALAIAQDCGPSATVRPDLRIIKDSAGKHIAELDAVVDYDDAFIIGSHKTKVAGDSDIKNLRRKVDEIVVHHPPFQGKRIELAFMTEHADEGAKQRLRDTAKVYNVRLFERNGRAISRVYCSRGMQGCRLI